MDGCRDHRPSGKSKRLKLNHYPRPSSRGSRPSSGGSRPRFRWLRPRSGWSRPWSRWLRPRCGSLRPRPEDLELGLDGSDLGLDGSDLGTDGSDLGLPASDLGAEGPDLGADDLALGLDNAGCDPDGFEPGANRSETRTSHVRVSTTGSPGTPERCVRSRRPAFYPLHRGHGRRGHNSCGGSPATAAPRSPERRESVLQPASLSSSISRNAARRESGASLSAR